MTAYKGFVGNSYYFDNVQFESSRSINMYPEVDENGTGDDNEVSQLKCRDGYQLALTLPTGSSIRGLYTATNGVTWAVAGNTVYTISGTPGNYSYSTIGTLLTSSGPVSIVDNNGFVVFVDNPNGYYYAKGVVQTAIVVNSGTGYQIGDTLTYSGISTGSGFSITVTAVDGSGAITAYTFAPGSQYTAGTYTNVPLVYTTSGSGTGATATLVIAATLFSQIVDPAWLGAASVVCYDTYFIFNVPNSNEIFWTFPNTVVPLDALNFDAKQGNSDPISAMWVNQRLLWLSGTQTTEVWVDQPSGNYTFSRIPGPFIQMGTLAPQSVAIAEVGTFFLAQSPRQSAQVFITNGMGVQKISTICVEQQLQKYGASLANSTAFCYEYKGHSFYQINPPSGTASWVYDATTSALLGQPCWHERTFTNAQGQQSRDLADNHCILNSVHLFGDYSSSNIYFVQSGTTPSHTDNGFTITYTRIAPHVSEAWDRLFWKYFQLKCQTGVGNSNDPGSNPQVTLYLSNDGGHTYGYPLPQPLGPIGQFQQVIRWYRLGFSRNRVVKVVCTDPVEFNIIGADVDVGVFKTPS